MPGWEGLVVMAKMLVGGHADKRREVPREEEKENKSL